MGKIVWTPEKIETLKHLHLLFSHADIAKRIGLTTLAVKSKARVLKLSKRRFWTKEEIEYVRLNYADQNTSAIALHLKRSMSAVFGLAEKLGVHKSEEFRNSPLSGRLKPGAKIGGATTFKKGQVPPNKGKKQSEYMTPEAIDRTKATRFKKGQLPKNTKEHDGEITIRTDSRTKRQYKYIRLSIGKWRELHLVIWEHHHGKPPKGYNVQFRDGNSLNVVIENLYLIKRKDQMKKNTIHRYPTEVKQAIRSLSRFNRKLKEYEKQD